MDKPVETQEVKTEMQQAILDFQQTRFYKWCDSILVGKFHYLVVPLTGFFDAFVIILPTELVLAVYLLRDRARSLVLHTTIVALCASLGYLILTLFASMIGPDILPWTTYVLGEEVTTQVEGVLTNYVFVLAITAGLTSIFPMPATAFAVVVGLVGAPLGWFILGTFIGKWIRFGSIAYVTRRYGMQAFDFYMKNATWVSLALLVLLGLYFYIK